MEIDYEKWHDGHRPLFLRFNTEKREERVEAFSRTMQAAENQP
jgi:hypothetical protein